MINFSACSCIRSLFDDLPSEMVLHCQRFHLRRRKCIVRRSTKHERVDRRPCSRRNWGGRYLHRCFIPHLRQYHRRRTVCPLPLPSNDSPKYIGMTGAMWGLGTVLGPVIGGAFTNSGATWRWAFYINLPIGALVAPILFFL